MFKDLNFDELQVKIDPNPGTRVKFLGDPYIFGQCILPTQMFVELDLPVRSPSQRHAGLSEGPVTRLNSDLSPHAGSLGSTSLFSGNIDAHLALMELNLALAIRFLHQERMQADLSDIKDQRQRAAIQRDGARCTDLADRYVRALKQKYQQASGLWLPN